MQWTSFTSWSLYRLRGVCGAGRLGDLSVRAFCNNVVAMDLRGEKENRTR